MRCTRAGAGTEGGGRCPRQCKLPINDRTRNPDPASSGGLRGRFARAGPRRARREASARGQRDHDPSEHASCSRSCPSSALSPGVRARLRPQVRVCHRAQVRVRHRAQVQVCVLVFVLKFVSVIALKFVFVFGVQPRCTCASSCSCSCSGAGTGGELMQSQRRFLALCRTTLRWVASTPGGEGRGPPPTRRCRRRCRARRSRIAAAAADDP